MVFTHSCFWALLSSEDFSIIYISKNVRDLGPSLGVNFIGSQLYGIVLPTEVPRMRKDLNAFKQSSSFNGAAIRCSAYNFKSISTNPYPFQGTPSSLAALNLPYSTYIMMIQAITSQVILAVFHIDEAFLNKKAENITAECFHNYEYEELNFLRQCLDNFELYQFRDLSLDPYSNQSIPSSPPFRDPSITPTRSLLIYDTYAPRVLLAWPKKSYTNLTQDSNPMIPSVDLNQLLHHHDSARLYKGFKDSLEANQKHRRIQFISQTENYSGARFEQVMYCIGNIAIASCQIMMPLDYQKENVLNPLNNSKSLSFSREQNMQYQYEVQKKTSAPVLMNTYHNQSSDYYQQDRQNLIPGSESYPENNIQTGSHQTLSRVRSSTLVPTTSRLDDSTPRKAVSNDSMYPHGNRSRSTSTSGKGSNKLFSFLPGLPNFNMNILPLKGRNNNKNNQDFDAQMKNATLPPISFISQNPSHPDQHLNTSLPSFNHLVSPSITSQPSLSSQTIYSNSSSITESTKLPPIKQEPMVDPLNTDGTLISPLLTNPTRFCLSCHTTTSPEWRRGPRGQKTLCNACGLKYARQLKALRLQGRTDAPPKNNPYNIVN